MRCTHFFVALDPGQLHPGASCRIVGSRVEWKDAKMAKKLREIIRIDESRCDGCGECVPACREGALRVVDGKARLVSEIYCDGLGACLGTCPRGAITIERREAEDFDEERAMEHARAARTEAQSRTESEELPCGCPGMMSKTITPRVKSEPAGGDGIASQLAHWPVKLALIPANAPCLRDADLVLLADCTAVACANLHRDFVSNKIVVMACPKLDDAEANIEKLARVIGEGWPRSIEVVMMEVPCCQGLMGIATEAARRAGSDIAIKKCVLSVEGNVLDRSGKN